MSVLLHVHRHACLCRVCHDKVERPSDGFQQHIMVAEAAILNEGIKNE